MAHRVATKTEEEKRDDHSKARVRPSPKDKPPRYDRHRKHYKETDPDMDRKKEKKDLSMKSHIAIEEAAIRLALQYRGVHPDMGDVRSICASVSGDIENPRFWPTLAAATFAHLDQKYKQARYTQLRRSPCGTKFEQGAPSPNRQIDTATWPVWTKIRHLTPSMITADDHDRIVGHAKVGIDPRVMADNRDAAFRKALDETIWGMDGGKYAGKIDAPTYLTLLNKISGMDYNLDHEVYIPTEVNEQQRSDVKGQIDPSQYWGKPADSSIDSGVTKKEKWRKLFEDGGVIQRDPEDDYLDNYRNPSI